jgi:tripartite ATP-independent transporter DctM subunit
LEPDRRLQGAGQVSAFERLLERLTAALIAAVVLVVGLQVVSRHLLRSPIPWTEEIARMLLVWSMLVGGVLALARKEHTRVTAVLRLLPSRFAQAVEAGTGMALILFLAVLGHQSCLLMWLSRSERLPASQLSGAWVTAPMPVAVALMALLTGAETFRNGREAFRSRWPAAVAVLTAALLVSTVIGPVLAEVTPIVVLGVGFLVTAGLGMPLAFALGWVSLAYLVGIGGVPLTILPIKMVGGVDSFVLLAIPLFIFGGALMETGGLAERIVTFATALVGHVRGGLAMVAVVAEMLFSGISGSTAADVSAISALLVPSMKKAGYSGEESVSIVAAASAMGILVPPCLTMVVLGSLANLSIVTLFLAGFIPAFVLAAVLVLVIAARARSQNWPLHPRSSAPALGAAVRGAAWPLGMPLIVFGGIFSGIVTVTEAALVAIVYAVVVGAFYRGLRLGEMGKLLATSGAVTAMTLWVLAAASVFAWILAREGVPDELAAWISGLGGGVPVFMTLSIVVFVGVGALLEGLPALLIFGPVLFPVAQRLGIDPIHYGIVIVACLGVAFFLPPIGVGLYIACGIGKVDVNDVFPSYRPYLLALLVGLGLVAAFPTLTLILPRIVQGYGGR